MKELLNPQVKGFTVRWGLVYILNSNITNENNLKLKYFDLFIDKLLWLDLNIIIMNIKYAH